MPNMDSIVITLEDKADIKAIGPKLKAAGFKSKSFLEKVGIVVGDIDPADRPNLYRIDGVTAVETKAVQLPTPDVLVQ